MAATAALTAMQGIIAMRLVQVNGDPLEDPQVRFQFRRPLDSRLEGDPVTLPVNGDVLRFQLPAFPLRPLLCDVTPSRYRYRPTNIFRVQAGQDVELKVEFAREPSVWKADFLKWVDLPALFESLKNILKDSSEVGLIGTGEVLKGNARSYDRLPHARWDLAKATMLNIHYRLSTLIEPISGVRPWISYLRRLRQVGRERIIAEADPDLYRIVEAIYRDIVEFHEHYERTPAENHRRNLPPEFQARAQMISIKSADEYGNLQLTVARMPGSNETLLDADIDENGDSLRHFFDVLRHKVTGGTHPFDIHEILTAENPAAELGYTLV